jgi:dolichol-phosphate mannosyltransferase
LKEYKVTDVYGIPSYKAIELGPRLSNAALVIPVINEGVKLTSQLSQLRSAGFNVDVIVADGGSADGSTGIDLLKSQGVRALLTKVGSGRLSAQLRMAFYWCQQEDYKYVVTMDGNGKDDIEGVVKILSALESGYDFVQGSRFIQGGLAVNTPKSRLLAIKLLHAPITSLAAGFTFTDSTNGFRGFSLKALMDERVSILRPVFDSYELLAYLPIRLAKVGFSVTEIPVVRRYPSSGQIPTKIHGLSAHVALFKILLRAAFGVFNPDKA